MPHYADGSEAKVGDQVTGKLYNTEGIRAGTIISITPGAESCNAMVQFTEAVPVDLDPGGEDPKPPRMAVRVAHQLPLWRDLCGEQHGSSGPTFRLFICADYCATNELTKVG
jgi:hypothetical protein